MNRKFLQSFLNHSWFSCLFFFFFFGKLFAQPETIKRNYSVADGLSSQTVYTALQDRDGYMWFATDAGACRFDGKNFTHFSIDEGLCDNEVLNIAEDSFGRIWFLTLSGCLSYYENGKIHNADTDVSLNVRTSNSSTYRFFEAKDNCIYLSGIGNEVIKISPELKCEILFSNEGHSKSHILVFENKNDDVLFRPSGFECPVAGSVPGSTEYIHHLTKTRANRTLATSPHGVGYFNDGIYTPVLFFGETTEGGLSCRAFIDDQDNIWVSTTQEGVQFFKKNDAGYDDPVKLYDGYPVNYVMVDRDGNEWYPTLGRGVLRIAASQQDIRSYRVKMDDQAMCLTSDNEGNIWSGTSSGFLCQLKGREMINQFQIVTGRKSVRFKDVLIDSLNHDLWCAGDFGLMRFNNQTLGIDPMMNMVVLKDVKSLSLASRNELILTLYDGLSHIFLQDGDPIIVKDSLVLPKRIYATHTDVKGNLWFENADELFCKRNDSIWSFPQLRPFFKHKITSINETIDGAIVVTTNGSGIHFIKDEKIIYTLSEANGLPSNSCKEIFIAGKQHYLATDLGMLIYSWDGSAAKIESQITQRDGLPSGIINDVLVTDSLIYLATSEGLVILDKYRSKKGSPPPPLHWNSFTSRDSSYQFTQPIVLGHDQSYITIHFTAISFDRPEDIEYQYKLREGDEWISTYNNSLDFPEFEHGKYKLLVRAKKHDSDWCQPIALSFVVLPPYWKTWWFRLIVLFVFVGIIISVFQFFQRRKFERQLALVRQEQAVLQERNRISSEMHDDLGSELTNIVILSRIAGSTLQVEGEKAEPLKKIDAAATEVISKMNEIIWALNPSNDSLEGLLNFLQRQFNDFLDFNEMDGHIILPELIPDQTLKMAFRRNVVLMVKEYLHNVKKHAGASKVRAKIEIETNELKIEVEENGKGFNESDLKTTGNGLRNMRKRATDHGGSLIISSSPGNGSSLLIRLPL